MKIIIVASLFVVNNLYGGFDFGGSDSGCEGGSGDFQQQINHYNEDYENAITVGSIPKDLKDVYISLKSDKDVDIRLYNANGEKIVHWPNGILSGSTKASKDYNGVKIEYSGYNGDGSGLGHEYIKISGTTKNDFLMKAFGYKAGYAEVDYSWTGKANCSGSSEPDASGSGEFQQQILFQDIVKVGDIPPGVNNLYISLKSDKDVDIQLYDKSGQKIVHWPDGLINGSGKETTNYKGMEIEWSGYNGDGTGLGNEYIKITGATSTDLVMKAYGYKAGYAQVNYTWGEDVKGGTCSVQKTYKSYLKNDNIKYFKPPSSPICVETGYNENTASDYAEKYYNTQYGGTGNKFSDFDKVVKGGNCTNFVSQCLLAGITGYSDNQKVYDLRESYFDPGYESNGKWYNDWYFVDFNNRAPAWSGANALYNYVKAQSAHPEYEGLKFKYVTHDTKTEFMEYTKVQIGDIIFADWPMSKNNQGEWEIDPENGNTDGTIDHSMIVTNTNSIYFGYNEIEVTYQSTNRLNKGLGDINEEYNEKALFYVYRPTGFSSSPK